MVMRQIEKEISILQNEFPIIAILGPRQSGKTTLSQKMFPRYTYVSLEDIDHRDFAHNDPRGFLTKYKSEVIFDEIQRVPDLMSYLQTHVDQYKEKGKIIITGSHNFLLMEQISQSLAGRVGISKLLPFSAIELRDLEANIDEILFKGSFPRIYDQHIRPETFYKNYIATYVEKDIRALKNITKLDTFMAFMRILAGRTAQELNLSTIGEECGVTHNTIKDWISVLEASFLVYKLKPFHKNYNKRIVKNPKIYFTDTGLVCSLIGIRKKEEIGYHFLRGSIFETYIVNEFLKEKFNGGEKFELYFWRDNHQKEIDVIVDWGISQYGVEVKASQTIHEKFFDGLKYWQNLTKSPFGSLYLVYSGKENYTRNEMNVVGWNAVGTQVIKSAI
jgi:uncharacterized protein